MTQQGLEAAVRGFRWLGHSDQGGRSDGTQVMVSDGYAYVAHPYSRGFSVIDCRDPRSPRAGGVATFPTPSDDDYARKGGTMGPHNVWENRPEAFQSEETIFITYQAAGLRAFDLSDHYRPEEVGHFVSPPPARMIDPRPGVPQVIHASDLYVASDGRTYVIDYNAGLNILQWEGS